MRSPLPEYLRLHCEEEVEDLLSPAKQLDRFCSAMREGLGVPVAYRDGPAAAHETAATCADRSRLVHAVGPGQLYLDDGDADSGQMPGGGQQLLHALGAWAEYVFQLYDAFRLGQAELATAVPVISRGGDRRQLFRRLEGVLRAAVEGFDCRAAAVYLLDDATTQLRLRAQWGLPESRWFQPPRPLSTAIADLEALTGHAVVIEDAQLLTHWNMPESCRAAVCLPVSSPTIPLGTFWLFSEVSRDFSPKETNLLEVVAGRISTELERYAMICDVRSQRRGTSRPPSELAAGITFPLPILDGWDMAVVGNAGMDDDPSSRPAWTQWRLVDRQQLAISAGNITPPAPDAWQTRCRLEGAIHATLLQGMDLDATSERLQHLLAQLSTGGDAAHLFCGIVDLEEGQLRFQSMGSLAGYLVRPHGWEPLVETSPPLDGCQLHVYPTVWQHLAGGDALLLCDLPAQAEPHSGHALAEYVLHHSHLPAAELAEGIERLAPVGSSGLLLVRREG